MKGAVLILGSILAWTALPAAAGTLYKCVDGDGATSYVSKRVPGARCQVFSRYTPGRAGPAPSAAGAAGAVSSPPQSASAAASVPPAQASSVPAAAPAPAPAAPGGRRVVSGQVYAYYKDGVRHYTSTPPRGVAGVSGLRTVKYSFIETCFACGNPGVNFGQLRLNTSAYQAEIAAAAREFGVEEAIIRAVMHAESAYNPRALSHAGAQGLMQLMPATARRFGVTDAFDAAQNIRGGVQYLAWLLKRYNGNLTLAAAGYNAGEGAVDRHGGVPPYRETQRYVERVALLAERYRGGPGRQ